MSIFLDRELSWLIWSQGRLGFNIINMAKLSLQARALEFDNDPQKQRDTGNDTDRAPGPLVGYRGPCLALSGSGTRIL